MGYGRAIGKPSKHELRCRQNVLTIERFFLYGFGKNLELTEKNVRKYYGHVFSETVIRRVIRRNNL